MVKHPYPFEDGGNNLIVKGLGSAYRVGRHTQMDRRPVGKSRLGQYWVVYITSTAGTPQGTLAATDFPTVDEVFDHDSRCRHSKHSAAELNKRFSGWSTGSLNFK